MKGKYGAQRAMPKPRPIPPKIRIENQAHFSALLSGITATTANNTKAIK